MALVEASVTNAPVGGRAATGERSGITNAPVGATQVQPSGATPGSAQPGANSFTESQARSRVEGQGYTQLGELTKDPNGIWRGRAMRNGQGVEVMVDYQGNVTHR